MFFVVWHLCTRFCDKDATSDIEVFIFLNSLSWIVLNHHKGICS